MLSKISLLPVIGLALIVMAMALFYWPDSLAFAQGTEKSEEVSPLCIKATEDKLIVCEYLVETFANDPNKLQFMLRSTWQPLSWEKVIAEEKLKQVEIQKAEKR